MRYYEWIKEEGRKMDNPSKIKVGDKVTHRSEHLSWVGVVDEIYTENEGRDWLAEVIYVDGSRTINEVIPLADLELFKHNKTFPNVGFIKDEDVTWGREEEVSCLTGGPAEYYDLPYGLWKTTNDMGEYLAINRWGAYSLHFKDLLKALVRFGVKKGTTQRYDVEKMIYSGCRVMVMLCGKRELRSYLIKLLNDPQFKLGADLGEVEE